MAKKTTKKKTTKSRTTAAAGAVTKRDNPWAARDAHTAKSLTNLAEGVVKSALSGREPKFDVPTRAASNTRWNKSRGILQMGPATNTRQLFNLTGTYPQYRPASHFRYSERRRTYRFSHYLCALFGIRQ